MTEDDVRLRELRIERDELARRIGAAREEIKTISSRLAVCRMNERDHAAAKLAARALLNELRSEADPFRARDGRPLSHWVDDVLYALLGTRSL